MSEKLDIPGSRRVPRTGVIYVMGKARERGSAIRKRPWGTPTAVAGFRALARGG